MAAPSRLQGRPPGPPVGGPRWSTRSCSPLTSRALWTPSMWVFRCRGRKSSALFWNTLGSPETTACCPFQQQQDSVLQGSRDHIFLRPRTFPSDGLPSVPTHLQMGSGGLSSWARGLVLEPREGPFSRLRSTFTGSLVPGILS